MSSNVDALNGCPGFLYRYLVLNVWKIEGKLPQSLSSEFNFRHACSVMNLLFSSNVVYKKQRSSNFDSLY